MVQNVFLDVFGAFVDVGQNCKETKNFDRHEAVGVDHWDGLVTSVAWGWSGNG